MSNTSKTTSKEMAVFSNTEFGEVRTVKRDDTVWFVAIDVCKCLGIKNTRDALKKVDIEDKGVSNTDTLKKDGVISNDVISKDGVGNTDVTITDSIGRVQKMNLVNESGLYSLIMLSRKPEAKAFKRWITSEVLPSIRKTGAYAAARNTKYDPAMLANRVIETLRTELDYKQAALEALTGAYKRVAEEHLEAQTDNDILVKRVLRLQEKVIELQEKMISKGWGNE